MGEVNDESIMERFRKDLPQKQIDNLRNAMEKYGENYWWESDDPVQVSMYQIS